jgi:hypothetical protein
MGEVDEIVFDTPLPTKVYQTPYSPTHVPGAVSLTAPTVVPARFVVPQGKDVALEHASFEG